LDNDEDKSESKRITYYLPVEIINKVNEQAKKRKMTKSAVVHQAIEDFLKNHGGYE
jgi:predicted transcriptional regulator